MYLLDTNAWVVHLRASSPKLSDRIRQEGSQGILLCSVVKAELLYGAYKSSRREENLALLEDLFSQFLSLPFGQGAADCYGRVRTELERTGTPIGANDLFIAAIALNSGLTLVTHNLRDFSRVPGLVIEDWQA